MEKKVGTREEWPKCISLITCIVRKQTNHSPGFFREQLGHAIIVLEK